MNAIIKSKNSKRMTTINLILLLTAFTSALVAGLLYAYSCSVNPGLGRLPDKEYLSAMQSINRAILNPVFFATFLGTTILLPLTTFLHRNQLEYIHFTLLLSATIIYLTGVVGVTFFGNVPLNNMLDKFNLQSSSLEEIASLRLKFEGRWNSLHTIRTIASVISLLLILITCINKSNITGYSNH